MGNSPICSALFALALLLGACSGGASQATPGTSATATVGPSLPPATAITTATAPAATSTTGATATVPATARPSATAVNVEELPAGEWVRLANMPTARSETAAAVLDGRIYVPGGLVNNPAFFVGSRALEAFDPAANRWEPLPELYEELHHLQAAAHSGRLYVFGGLPGCAACGNAEPRAVVYDPAVNAWSDLSAMPDWWAGGAAVALGDYIYLVGGYNDRVTRGEISDLWRYDPAADTWTELAPLRQHREHTSAVAFDNRLYVLGGRWEAGDLNTIEIYDPATNTWMAGPPMREARAGHGAAVVGQAIYVVGGERLGVFPEEIVDSVEVYDPASNRWTNRFELPYGLHGVPAAGVEGVLFVLGGSRRAGTVDNTGAVWAYRAYRP